MTPDATLAARVTVDLDALAANWRALDELSGGTASAVVKADAYGLGAARVAPALARAGARRFFVALPDEGAALRAVLGPGPEICILGGFAPADIAVFRDHALVPVLNSAAQARAWFAAMPGAPAGLQVDSGMNRLGMEADELAGLLPLPPSVGFVMSHLACADEPEHPLNARQLGDFRALTDGLGLPRSLAATGGILLGRAFRFDFTRPGVGIYGGAPFAESRPVVTLEVPVIQLRDVAPGEAVGYGATWTADRPARIATIAAGYADGILRAAGAGGLAAFHAGRRLPGAGRVSMDLITLDVTGCAEIGPGTMVEILGPSQGVDQLAAAAGTIGYEILTSLGSRYSRRYTGG
ncbi:alanine racemase [Limibaculum sp. FT325]|uniref:alanine racemase n=1 Tax=Thermohalobaculum sediminis TaxID=2939436 RepID=UPI0020BF9064|nr:alanine racemase [Limibaculum sediminis]MCL5775613.1 alanine racemase [Limibaculum sediminis]